MTLKPGDKLQGGSSARSKRGDGCAVLFKTRLQSNGIPLEVSFEEVQTGCSSIGMACILLIYLYGRAHYV